jgi:cytochrome oxidase Cu insertion factor (SCO1/SenC/PrrC family)
MAAAGLTVAAFARARVRAEPPPVMSRLPSFALVEANGRTVTADDLRGRPWVADFIFTRCAGACPVMTARMAALRRQSPEDVTFVSITVDPAHDTPEVLGRYARRAGAGVGWLFLTGPQDALYRLAIEGFKLGVEEVPPERQPAGDGPFLHSSHFVLVDGKGYVRGYYDSTDEEALSRLRRDLASVRSERT